MTSYPIHRPAPSLASIVLLGFLEDPLNARPRARRTREEERVASVSRKHDYYQLVRYYRTEDGKPRTGVLVHLGEHPTPEDAPGAWPNKIDEHREAGRDQQAETLQVKLAHLRQPTEGDERTSLTPTQVSKARFAGHVENQVKHGYGDKAHKQGHCSIVQMVKAQEAPRWRRGALPAELRPQEPSGYRQARGECQCVARGAFGRAAPVFSNPPSVPGGRCARGIPGGNNRGPRR
jgi:hypothetical protein